MLMTLLIVLLVFALLGGAAGHPRYGFTGWSPAGVILVAMIVLYAAGMLHR